MTRRREEQSNTLPRSLLSCSAVTTPLWPSPSADPETSCRVHTSSDRDPTVRTSFMNRWEVVWCGVHTSTLTPFPPPLSFPIRQWMAAARRKVLPVPKAPLTSNGGPLGGRERMRRRASLWSWEHSSTHGSVGRGCGHTVGKSPSSGSSSLAIRAEDKDSRAWYRRSNLERLWKNFALTGMVNSLSRNPQCRSLATPERSKTTPSLS